MKSKSFRVALGDGYDSNDEETTESVPMVTSKRDLEGAEHFATEDETGEGNYQYAYADAYQPNMMPPMKKKKKKSNKGKVIAFLVFCVVVCAGLFIYLQKKNQAAQQSSFYGMSPYTTGFGGDEQVCRPEEGMMAAAAPAESDGKILGFDKNTAIFGGLGLCCFGMCALKMFMPESQQSIARREAAQARERECCGTQCCMGPGELLSFTWQIVFLVACIPTICMFR